MMITEMWIPERPKDNGFSSKLVVERSYGNLELELELDVNKGVTYGLNRQAFWSVSFCGVKVFFLEGSQQYDELAKTSGEDLLLQRAYEMLTEQVSFSILCTMLERVSNKSFIAGQKAKENEVKQALGIWESSEYENP